MYEELALKLKGARPNLAEIEVKTGITVRTMENIIANSSAPRSRSTIIALENYFKGKRK